MSLGIEWRENELIFDRIKIMQGAFTIVGLNDVTIVYVVG